MYVRMSYMPLQMVVHKDTPAPPAIQSLACQKFSRMKRCDSETGLDPAHTR